MSIFTDNKAATDIAIKIVEDMVRAYSARPTPRNHEEYKSLKTLMLNRSILKCQQKFKGKWEVKDARFIEALIDGLYNG